MFKDLSIKCVFLIDKGYPQNFSFKKRLRTFETLNFCQDSARIRIRSWIRIRIRNHRKRICGSGSVSKWNGSTTLRISMEDVTRIYEHGGRWHGLFRLSEIIRTNVMNVRNSDRIMGLCRWIVIATNRTELMVGPLSLGQRCWRIMGSIKLPGLECESTDVKKI